ncbi:MAG: hypothetical protein J7M40_19205, partial [Planctomycetes bacterium]|nr:hypothetical protein [Planctomycetota bacterium]
MRITLFALILAGIFFILSCSSGNPVSVDPGPQIRPDHTSAMVLSENHLWGYYDCTVDPEKLTVTSVPNRNMFFTSNVGNLLKKVRAGGDWIT